MDGQQINLNVDADKIEARYCDQVMMNMNPFGFTFDFVQQIPQMKAAKVLSRVAMSPEHTKVFAEMLQAALKQYEANFGEIKLTSKMKEEAKKQIGFQAENKK